MKIPVYTAQASVTREAPGRQIRARQSPSAMAQAELDKQKPMGAALKAAGDYAQTRYKIQTENNLNEALLDAQEALRERRKELEKDPDYNNILDGDNPIWNKETDQLKRELLKKVGKDRYALQQFNSRFGNLELQNRFALRDAVDQRVQIAAEQNRARKLNDAEDQIANSLDLSQISFVLKDVIQDTQKLAQIRAGNLDVLTKQQKEMIKRAAYRALEKNADNAPSGIAFIDEIRVALRDGVSADSLDPRGEGKTSLSSNEAAYVYGLMQMLDPADQAQVLKSVGGTQSFIEGPSLAEQNAQKLAKGFSSEISNSITVRIDEISKGNVQSPEAMTELRNQVSAISQSLSAEDQINLGNQVRKIEILNGVQTELNRKANLNNIDQFIDLYSKGMKGEGGEGIDTEIEQSVLENIKSFKETMVEQLSVKGDAIAFAEATKMDGVKINSVDLSPEAVINKTSGLQERVSAGNVIRELNNLNYTPVLSKQESDFIVSLADSEGFDAVPYIKELTNNLPLESRGILLENLRSAGLAPEIIQSVYMKESDKYLIADLIAVKDLTVQDLKKTLPSTDISGSTGVAQTISNNSKFQDYSAAYVSGGDGAGATKLLNEQYQMIEKLSYRLVQKGDSVGDAVEKAINAIFSGEVVTGKNVQFIVPDNIDPVAVEKAAEEFLAPGTLNRFSFAPLSFEALGYREEFEISEASLRSNGMWLNNGTGDGLVLHYNLNGNFIPVLIDTGDPSAEVQMLEMKFSDLANMDFELLRSSRYGFNTKTIGEFAKGFNLGGTSEGRNIPRSTVVSSNKNVDTNKASRGRNNPR